MNKFSFEASAFAIALGSAKSGWQVAEHRSDNIAQQAVAALLLNALPLAEGETEQGGLDDLALAVTFYNVFAPKNGKGKACAPKALDNGRVSVRNLEQADCKGSGGARVALESILYVFYERETSDATLAMVEAFAMGAKHDGKTVRLNPLKAFIKAEKSRIAAEKAEKAVGGKAENDDGGETAIADATTDAERLVAALGLLKAVTSSGDASERLVLTAIAAEIDRISAIEAPAEQVAEAA